MSLLTECDVLVLDDASPNPGFSESVETLCAELGIGYYRSPRNLGIPRNVNVGLIRAVQAGYDHVLIANSDVMFAGATVDRLLTSLTSDERIGSVTAFSNNVSIYSLPNDDPDRHLADQGFVDWIGDTLNDEFGSTAVDIPAGISFCILIPTRVLRSVGLMDPVFGRGYCEETDWTLRSQSLGYRIALAPSAFVYHQGQGSNLEAGLLASGHTSVPAHERIVDLRYPIFREQVDAFINSELRDVLWNSARRSIIIRAGRDLGYRILIGPPDAPGPDVSGPVVTFKRGAGALVPEATYRGFRLQIPSPPQGDLVQPIVDFFGCPPVTVRLQDHSVTSNEIAEAMARSGLDVHPRLGYPAHV
jgi:GT2 family glycosyltransferase